MSILNRADVLAGLFYGLFLNIWLLLIVGVTRIVQQLVNNVLLNIEQLSNG